MTARQNKMPRRTIPLLGLLYVSQSIPLGFFVVALPAIARSEGLSLERVGLLQALAFPFLLKFLWAPLVDRFGSARRGHYRSWIVPLQIGSVIAVVALATLDPFAALKGSASATPVVLLITLTAVYMMCAATQDVATDGLAVRAVDEGRRGLANSFQVGGYYLGQILGGGLVLLLFDSFGWTGALLGMATLLASPLLLLPSYREPSIGHVELGRTSRGVGFASLRRFFARPGVSLWILVLLTYRAGEAMALAMLNPMLIDQGHSLQRVALTVGLAGSIASLMGALVGGRLVERFPRRRVLVLLGVAQALALVTYTAPARNGEWALVLGAVVAASFAGGAATTALYAAMMDRCSQRAAGSDFTVQQSLCAVGPLVGVGLSGVSAAHLGYAPHFAVCAVLALSSAVLVALFITQRHGAVPASAPQPT